MTPEDLAAWKRFLAGLDRVAQDVTAAVAELRAVLETAEQAR